MVLREYLSDNFYNSPLFFKPFLNSYNSDGARSLTLWNIIYTSDIVKQTPPTNVSTLWRLLSRMRDSTISIYYSPRANEINFTSYLSPTNLYHLKIHAAIHKYNYLLHMLYLHRYLVQIEYISLHLISNTK